MSEQYKSSQSPLTWIIIAIIAAIMVLVFFSGRSGSTVEQISLSSNDKEASFAGKIEREVVTPPGLMARELIRQTREQQKPYPLIELHEKALQLQAQNNMADAHLLYFFNAREGYLPSILKMAEMSDPVLYDKEQSLLDEPDPVQAYKWYRIAMQKNDAGATASMERLIQWASLNENLNNKAAQQLLIGFAQSNQ